MMPDAADRSATFKLQKYFVSNHELLKRMLRIRSAFDFFFYDPAMLLHRCQRVAHGLEHRRRGRSVLSAFHQLRNQTGLALNALKSGSDIGVCLPQMLKFCAPVHYNVASYARFHNGPRAVSFSVSRMVRSKVAAM